MKEGWRWFGPVDKVTLPEIAQTGASAIVTALHEIPYGEVWEIEAIKARQNLVESGDLGLTWSIVESLPIHENIKRGAGDLNKLFDSYRQSMVNLAACGIKTICYNFMPVLDWTRTILDAEVRGNATALRFDAVRMAAFELFMLKRAEAEDDYSQDVVKEAAIWFQSSSDQDRETLLNSIMAGLPGAYDRYSVDGLRNELSKYDGIGRKELRANYKRFLEQVIPTAEELGIGMCVHPDDPPRDILGLPRIVSTAEDINWIMSAVDKPSNGLTLCSGSLGAHPNNDVVGIARKHADRIHFAHLRNVAKEINGSFQEAAHLEGDTDMVALVDVLMKESERRGEDIVWRPDHGHEIGPDLERGAHPGYPLIGRLRGLAEIRGVIEGLKFATR